MERAKFSFKHTIILLIISVMIILAAFFPYAFRQMNNEKILDGVSVNGVNIGGLTFAEAYDKIMEHDKTILAQSIITLNFEGSEEVLTFEDIGVSPNIQQAIEQASVLGKTNGVLSYFRAYFDVKKSGYNFKTQIIINENLLAAKVDELSEKYLIQPKNAQISFHPDAKNIFDIEPEQQGRKIDKESLTEKLKEIVNKRSINQTIDINFLPIEPEKNSIDLEKNTALIGYCTTTLTDDDNRNTNIRLLGKELNGLTLLPGEIFSINETAGERTEEKGYKPAPAITNGNTLILDYGGGICQVAGTLYNALLMTDLEIVERNKHSWPSNYLPLGQDAMVTWPDKDLKFKNTHDGPVFIKAEIVDDNLIVEVYGAKPADGVEITVHTEIVETEEPPSPVIRKDDTLKLGKRVTVITARDGYITMTYRYYMKDDVQIKEELICRTHYRPIQGEYIIGTKTEPAVPGEEDLNK